MQTVTKYIRAHLLNATGYRPPTKRAPDLSELRKMQRSPEFLRLRNRGMQRSEQFDDLCSNRLVLGHMRYGPVRQQKAVYDNIESAITRLRRYQETGNREHLVDAANLCEVEFVNGRHPKGHWDPSDDGEHTPRYRSK